MCVSINYIDTESLVDLSLFCLAVFRTITIFFFHYHHFFCFIVLEVQEREKGERGVVSWFGCLVDYFVIFHLCLGIFSRLVKQLVNHHHHYHYYHIVDIYTISTARICLGNRTSGSRNDLPLENNQRPRSGFWIFCNGFISDFNFYFFHTLSCLVLC